MCNASVLLQEHAVHKFLMVLKTIGVSIPCIVLILCTVMEEGIHYSCVSYSIDNCILNEILFDEIHKWIVYNHIYCSHEYMRKAHVKMVALP